jgi:hypothetical protein
MKRVQTLILAAIVFFLLLQRLPAPIVEESSTPAPEQSAKPKLKRTIKPEATTKSALPSAPPKQEAASNEIVAKIKQLEMKLEASVPKHDVSTPGSLLSDDYRGVTSKGKVINKPGLLDALSKDSDEYSSANIQALDVRVYSPTMAVAIGTAREKGKSRDGKTFDRSVRFTDTWMLRDGRWQCTAIKTNSVASE